MDIVQRRVIEINPTDTLPTRQDLPQTFNFDDPQSDDVLQACEYMDRYGVVQIALLSETRRMEYQVRLSQAIRSLHEFIDTDFFYRGAITCHPVDDTVPVPTAYHNEATRALRAEAAGSVYKLATGLGFTHARLCFDRLSIVHGSANHERTHKPTQNQFESLTGFINLEDSQVHVELSDGASILVFPGSLFLCCNATTIVKISYNDLKSTRRFPLVHFTMRLAKIAAGSSLPESEATHVGKFLRRVLHNKSTPIMPCGRRIPILTTPRTGILQNISPSVRKAIDATSGVLESYATNVPDYIPAESMLYQMQLICDNMQPHANNRQYFQCREYSRVQVLVDSTLQHLNAPPSDLEEEETPTTRPAAYTQPSSDSYHEEPSSRSQDSYDEDEDEDDDDYDGGAVMYFKPPKSWIL